MVNRGQSYGHHHARLLCGDLETCQAVAFSEVGYDREDDGGPDIHILQYGQFGIDESRALKKSAAQRPIQRNLRTFVLIVDSVTHEAQNALLKLFEDPPRTAQFYLIMSQEDMLIPTLLSRFYVTRHVEPKLQTPIGDEFLAYSYARRLDVIAKKVKEKDSIWIRSLMSDIEALLYRDGVQKNQQALQEIIRASSYIGIRGASPKMLLEHVALSVPQKTFRTTKGVAVQGVQG